MVKILLGRGEVNPNKKDSDGDTPLSCAVRRGHERVVEILLRRDEVIPNKPDNGGQTPRMNAASQGYQRMIELLDTREAATLSRGGNTPRRLSPFLPFRIAFLTEAVLEHQPLAERSPVL